MHPAAVERIEPAELPQALPFRSIQSASQTSSLLMLALVLPGAAAFIYPFLLLLLLLSESAGARATMLDTYSAIPSLVIAFAFWIVLFAFPLKRIVDTLARKRTIEIGDDLVSVTEETLFGMHSWQEPVSGFAGVVHHVRSSLSGNRHELLLVHPDSDKTLVLGLAPRFGQNEIDQVAELLGCAEISSREVFRVRSMLGIPNTFRRMPSIQDQQA